MLDYLFLRYRATTGDPWTLPPLLALSAPLATPGALPLAALSFETTPLLVTPCGCPLDPTATDDHLSARFTTIPLLRVEAELVRTFLIHFKQAALHEASLTGFGPGGFVTTSLFNIRSAVDHRDERIAGRITIPLSFYP